MTSFTVTPVTHRMLGPLLRLTLADGLALDLTAEEAAILSRALRAVAEGRSAERTIFMSPIASDHDFTGAVDGDGVAVGTTRLDWPEVRALADALASA